MRSSFLFFLFFSFFQTLSAQSGHEIKVKLDGFEEDVLYLAYHYGSKQFVKDTVYRATDDTFTFKRQNESLEPGMYMIVIPPENQFLELLITAEEQYFSLSASLDDLVGTVTFQGDAEENRVFYRYLNFLNTQRAKVTASNEDDSGQSSESEKEALRSQVDKEVRDYQNRLTIEYPKRFTTALVKANLPIDYTALTDDSDSAKLRYTQDHIFDQLDLNDDRLIRTALLEEKVNYFTDKLHLQRPQDVIPAIDRVLSLMNPEGENFKYFTIHFLNKYANSKIVGMDEVYVHIAQTYYGKGLAPWVAPDVLEKILNNAARIEPLLIGKIAPDLNLETRGGIAVDLHDIESEFTVLYFWRNDCKSCEKEAPNLQEFYKNFKDEGVKIAAICVNKGTDVAGCWDYADENNYNDWIHLADPNEKSDMWRTYDLIGTPIIYLLDKEKKIISKRISASQLGEVVDFELEKK